MSTTNSKHDEGRVDPVVHTGERINNYSGYPAWDAANRPAIKKNVHTVPAASQSRLPARSKQRARIEPVDSTEPKAKAASAAAARAESYLARGVFGLVVMKL